jgi:hypothetical protein
MPENRDGAKKPYQFEIPTALKDKAVRKAKMNGFSIAELMRMHIAEFVDRPIEQSVEMLRNFNQRNRPKAKASVQIERAGTHRRIR